MTAKSVYETLAIVDIGDLTAEVTPHYIVMLSTGMSHIWIAIKIAKMIYELNLSDSIAVFNVGRFDFEATLLANTCSKFRVSPTKSVAILIVIDDNRLCVGCCVEKGDLERMPNILR